jgi:glutamate-1-semialdehyde 2,1-aminomutase
MMILAILQARYSSSRLHGKVLEKILDKPMLQMEIERVLRSKHIDKLVVATSTSKDDDSIEHLCQHLNIECFRGNLDDVLERFYQAAKEFNADHIVRLTGDCPLHDHKVIDDLVDFYFNGKFDFATNTIEPTFPDGQDVWVFSFDTLEKTWKNSKLPSEREHVCTFMINHPELFKQGLYKRTTDLSFMRWAVDEQQDFEFVCQVYSALYPTNPYFTTDDILNLIEKKPELKEINQTFDRDEGLQKSLLKDRQKHIKQYGNNKPKSLDMQRRAKERIPGMSQLLSKRVDQFSEGVWPGYFSKAKGAYVWDLDGNQYIDMSISGIGANILGYADDDVNAAVVKAIQDGSSSSLNCPEEVELAELLCDIHPWAEKARFTRSGGESMAVAVRIARAFTNRDLIACCGYHGWHDWYLAANLSMENSLGEHLLPGLEPRGVPKALAGTILPFRYNMINDLKQIVAKCGHQIAAIVMEPVRNDQPLPGFLEEVRNIADTIGAVLIFDEITSAFRMNSAGAHMLFGVIPDIAVFAKAIGNGYPIGAIIGKGEIMDAAQSSFISSTNWTERIGPVAALATIKKHARFKVGDQLMHLGKKIQEGWADAARKNDIQVNIGGIPPLSHFTFLSPKHLAMKALFIQLMQEKGFLASNLYYAMYAHKQWHVNAYLEAVNEAFVEISRLLQEDKIETSLIGKPAAAGFKRLN